MSVTTQSGDNLSNDTNFGSHPLVATTVNTDRGIYSGALCSVSGLDAEAGSNKRSGGSPAVDSNDPAVRRVVYNLYRGLLGTYNDKANDILSNVPAERVREDQGISKQIESMIKQSSDIKNNISGPKAVDNDSKASYLKEANSPGMAAPPPPPPMPTNGPLPSIKLNSEIGPAASSSSKGGKHVPGGGVPFSYIPPAAIQNAMMTKDKKPFTYTPGGIDLSEIRSPRMQRRISKNAADEGVIVNIPQTNNSTPNLTPQAIAAMQPQIPVPVFPPQPPPPPHPSSHVSHSSIPGHSSYSPNPMVVPSSVPLSPVASPPPPTLKSTFQMSGSNPTSNSLTSASTSQISPPFQQTNPKVTSDCFSETETNKSLENCSSTSSPLQNSTPQLIISQPGPFVERRNVQVGSIYVPPVTPNNPNSGVTSPPAQLNKAPMPWMNSQNRYQSQSPPPFVQHLSPTTDRFASTHREESVPLTTTGSQVRMIPIAVEGQDETAESRDHLYQRNTSLREDIQHQVPWQTDSGRIIPIHLEGSTPQMQVSEPHAVKATPIQQQQHPPWRTAATCSNNQAQLSSMMEDLNVATNGRQDDSTSIQYTRSLSQQPTQSRSFRILQMITDTGDEGAQDNSSEPTESGRHSRSSVSSSGSGGTLGRPAQQNERRLVLTQEDRDLMDMFRSQVNEEHSLHQEVDPRYRGSHIPSRAFRILQNFTDSSDVADGPQQHITVRQPNSSQAQDTRNVGVSSVRKQPSEQSEPEPRKYMGSSIPSRSFRLLQAMTADPNDINGFLLPSEYTVPNGCEIRDKHTKIQHPNCKMFCKLHERNDEFNELLSNQQPRKYSPNLNAFCCDENNKSSQRQSNLFPQTAKESSEFIISEKCIERNGSILNLTVPNLCEETPVNKLLNDIPSPTLELRQSGFDSDLETLNNIPNNIEKCTHSVCASSHNPDCVKNGDVKQSSETIKLIKLHRSCQEPSSQIDVDLKNSDGGCIRGEQHSRLLRLFTDEINDQGSNALEDSSKVSSSNCFLIQEMESVIPKALPGTRLRIRSRRAKNYIPSRLFRSLQQEFDGSPPEDFCLSGSLDQSSFRRNLSNPSLTPETPSSAASELESYFTKQKTCEDTQ